jgi:hypothetical protein
MQGAPRSGSGRVGALDLDEFKEFRNIEDRQVYLKELSEKVISKAAPVTVTVR